MYIYPAQRSQRVNIPNISYLYIMIGCLDRLGCLICEQQINTHNREVFMVYKLQTNIINTFMKGEKQVKVFSGEQQYN